MTMQYIKSLTDWSRTLQCRAVWATSGGVARRIVSIGRKWLWVIPAACDGPGAAVRPVMVGEVTEIRGL